MCEILLINCNYLDPSSYLCPRMKKKLLGKPIILTGLLLSIHLTTLCAQCPMCRMTAEGNLAEGGMAGAGLNIGILYMLSGPYILFGVIAYLWWRNHKKSMDTK